MVIFHSYVSLPEGSWAHPTCPIRKTRVEQPADTKTHHPRGAQGSTRVSAAAHHLSDDGYNWDDTTGVYKNIYYNIYIL